MSKPSLYDEESIRSRLELQQQHAWDLEKSIAWNTKIDLNKFLVPLDENAVVFPGASNEQRLVISQMMGLVIAAAVFEMEECLVRLKSEAFDKIHRALPVSPEFIELGERFYLEESKHSKAFRRYTLKFSEALGVDYDVLMSILPKVEKTNTEKALKLNLKTGGQVFWWCVAGVEQQFLHIYNAMAPHEKIIEPLYFDLNKKHFEEEVRHSPFPYLMLDLLCNRNPSIINILHKKADLAITQVLQALWAVNSLSRLKKAKDLQSKSPFFKVASTCMPLLEKQPPHRILWKLATNSPYISSLINPLGSKRVLRFANETGAITLPFPALNGEKLEDY